MRIDSSGNVGMGTAANGLGIKLEVRSSNQITDARGMVAINSTNTAATNLGGSISFGGENGQATTPYNFGSIAGRYEGSGYLGYLQFSTTGAGSVVTEQMRIDSAGLLKFNSGYGSAATAYGCRAWVNFNGTGTVAIRGSGNVSSITDNGTGDYTVNFTTSMPDVNYAYSHSYSNEVNVQHTIGFLSSLLSSSLRVSHYNAANSANTADKSYVFIAIFR